MGDQFYLVGLAWLTMQLTGSSLALGTDRFSPRSVMLVSNALRAVITIILAALAFTNTLQLWQLYVLAAGFGIVDAFFYPAYGSMIPLTLNKENLEAGNGIMYGTMQLSLLTGPAAAGFLIANTGLPFAFAFDTATFVFASMTLILMRLNLSPQPGEARPDEKGGAYYTSQLVYDQSRFAQVYNTIMNTFSLDIF